MVTVFVKLLCCNHVHSVICLSPSDMSIDSTTHINKPKCSALTISCDNTESTIIAKALKMLKLKAKTCKTLLEKA